MFLQHSKDVISHYRLVLECRPYIRFFSPYFIS